MLTLLGGCSVSNSQVTPTLLYLVAQSRIFYSMQASICLWVDDRLIILRTKDHPGLVTVAACCSKPLRDRSSRFVQHLRPCQEAVVSCNQQSLSGGRRSCISTVSTSIPSTVRVVVGPSGLSGSIGIPSS